MALMSGKLFAGALFIGVLLGGQQDAEQTQSSYGGGRSAEERDHLYREHHEYLDELREIHVQIADDMRGARTIAIRSDMVVPDEILPRAMRGRVQPVHVADVIGNPLILATLAVLIDEADD